MRERECVCVRACGAVYLSNNSQTITALTNATCIYNEQRSSGGGILGSTLAISWSWIGLGEVDTIFSRRAVEFGGGRIDWHHRIRDSWSRVQ